MPTPPPKRRPGRPRLASGQSTERLTIRVTPEVSRHVETSGGAAYVRGLIETDIRKRPRPAPPQ